MRRVRILGHPVHPITVHLPLGALITASAFELLALGGLPSSEPARWTLAAGLLGGGIAVGTGLLDLLAAPEGPRVERRLLQHLTAMSAALACYAAAYALDPSSPAVVLGLHVSGLVLLAIGGWAGGELVYGQGVGVQPLEGGVPCTSRPSPPPAETSSSR